MKTPPFYICVMLLVFNAGIGTAQKKLVNGVWHAALTTATGKQIPFNFEVKDTLGKKQLAIINGSERFKVSDIETKDDSILIHMPLFDSEIKTRVEGNTLKGKWIKHLPQKDVAMDFFARPNEPVRFLDARTKPRYNIQGRWSAIFAGGETTVAEFKQQGGALTGTFLTTSGDYRYLEGVVAGDSLYLSCFDGGHAYLFTAKIEDGQAISNGKFYAGYSSISDWAAVKNDAAKLPDAYSLTALKPGIKKVDFTFADLNGKKVSLSNPQFKNKVVILQLMGSWCPNCMDETAYMVNFYKKYQTLGVEVVGLAYERSADFNLSKASLSLVQKRFNVPYPILITGYTTAKNEVIKSLPMMADFSAFPTTIIIDKQGTVRKIHTGFSGPGTGNYYTEFINEFEKLIDGLVAEK